TAPDGGGITGVVLGSVEPDAGGEYRVPLRAVPAQYHRAQVDVAHAAFAAVDAQSLEIQRGALNRDDGFHTVISAEELASGDPDEAVGERRNRAGVAAGQRVAAGIHHIGDVVVHQIGSVVEPRRRRQEGAAG